MFKKPVDEAAANNIRVMVVKGGLRQGKRRLDGRRESVLSEIPAVKFAQVECFCRKFPIRAERRTNTIGNPGAPWSSPFEPKRTGKSPRLILGRSSSLLSRPPQNSASTEQYGAQFEQTATAWTGDGTTGLDIR